MTAASELVGAAVEYGRAGWAVFPIEPRGKRPLVAWKDAATGDEATIRGWWARWPTANVAAACGPSNLYVVDVDGPEGAASLARLEAEHGPVVTLGATTGRGRHLYFQAPNGGGRNSAGKLGPGLDTRGDGGYVIVPPSVHATGRRYEWEDGPDRPTAAPDWLTAVPAPPPTRLPARPAGYAGPVTTADARRAAAGLVAMADQLARQREGNRNGFLHWSACRAGEDIARGHLAEGEVRVVLLGAALDAGLPYIEASATIGSGLRTAGIGGAA